MTAGQSGALVKRGQKHGAQFFYSYIKRECMLHYKINVLQALKEAGYTTYRLQKEKLLSAGTVQKIRNGDASLSAESINVICSVLRCQPGDLLEWILEDEEPQ